MTQQFYCTCGNETGWSHLFDQWWVHPECGKPSKLPWLGRMGFEDMTIWATPPRGVTRSTVRIGPDIRHHYTYMCDANDECYAVAYATTEEHARAELDGHVCPASARRDMIPSGKTAVQKMWDELDEVIVKIKEHDPSTVVDWIDEERIELTFYAKGLAMALAFVSIPYFRSQEDILRQANRRWRMRAKEIPWEATPGYNFYPAAPLAYVQKEEKPLKARAPLKAAPKKKVAPPAPPRREFTVGERDLIRKHVHAADLAVSDLANLYGVSEDRIRAIAGPKPGDDPQNDLMPITIF